MSFAYGFGLPHWHPLSGAFSPLSLFSGGVQGAFYDPSDPTTLFSDRAGTTPCGTPGGGSVVPVGLMLDKSQGLVLGSELVTPEANRDFSSDTGYWTKETGVTISGGTANWSATSNSWLYRTNLLTVGKFYQITWTISSYTAGVFRLTGGGTTGQNRTATGTYTEIYYASSAATLAVAGISGATGSVDNISVRELAGNHAIAANDTTARPELRARVNLLTYSEDFSNAAWGTGAGGGASISKGTTTGVRPDGTTGTVHTLTFSAVSAGQFAIAFQAAAQAFLNVQLTSSLYVRVASGTATIYLNLEDSGTPPSGTNFVAGSAQTVTTSWQRISLTGTRATAPNAVAVVIGFDTRAAAGQTNAAPFTLEVWGAQLTATNEFPANTYQRISDANTYDAVGFPRYLTFNGTSSAMSTPGNVNLSGTDKVTVFAGVRKLSTGVGGIVELSATTSNPGTFNLFANGIAVNDYFFSLSGTNQLYGNNTGFAPPVSNVLTEQLNQAGATDAQRLSARSNGTSLTLTYSANIGTPGNFGSYPLFIGSRNNTISFLNGNIYSIIVVGSAVSAGQISATEQWVAGKTGITI